MKKIFNLENLIYFSLAAIPLYLARCTIFGIPTNIFELLAVACVVIFFFQKKSAVELYSGRKKYLLLLGLLLMGLIISALLNDNQRSELGIIKSWFIIPLLFSAVVTASVKKENIFKALYLSAFFVSALALVYFFLGQVTFDGRLQAFYNSPNYLAMYLAPAILIGFFNLRENKKFYGFSLGVILAGFYLTLSYAAWLALVFAGILTFLVVKRGKKAWKIGLILLSILVLFLLLQIGTQKMSDFVQFNKRSSVASRIMIWSVAGKIISNNWLVGIGPGNFQEKYLAYQKYFPPYLEWAVPQPHNLFLAIWLQAGLVGFIGFVSLLVLWFADVWKQKKNSLLAGLSLAIMLYILLHGLVDTTYFKNDLATVFWLVFLSAI